MKKSEPLVSLFFFGASEMNAIDYTINDTVRDHTETALFKRTCNFVWPTGKNFPYDFLRCGFYLWSLLKPVTQTSFMARSIFLWYLIYIFMTPVCMRCQARHKGRGLGDMHHTPRHKNTMFT